MTKKKVLISIDEDLLEVLDKVATEMEISRSSMIEACIESGLDDLRLLSFIGLSPARLRKVGLALQKIGVFKSGGYEINVKDSLRNWKKSRGGGY